MADQPKSESTQPSIEEDRLGQALISRGLLTREEFQQCRASAEQDVGAEALLTRLVKAGFLTIHQARRALQERSQLVGQQIPGFQMLEKLGQGSMGTVYKARQISMNRLVAVKILLQKLASNPEFLERFTREAHLAAKFSSNNIVQAIDVGSAGPFHYFVMEYVEGTTIRAELEKGKIYTEHEAVEIVLQIAQALEHAHRRGLIHRDIKPANIILTEDGIAKLADLGLARQISDVKVIEAEKGLAVGTPYYIAPEQIEARDDIDIRADIYSLGATLYHMVTGQPPFPSKDVEEVIRSHLEEELTPPDHLNTSLSSGLGEVVEFMMAKSRKKRYRTPADLIIDLECLMNGEPPKLARQRIEASTLANLASGETDDDSAEEDAEPPPFLQRPVPLLWAAVLVGVLALSLLFNLVLLLK